MKLLSSKIHVAKMFPSNIVRFNPNRACYQFPDSTERHYDDGFFVTMVNYWLKLLSKAIAT